MNDADPERLSKEREPFLRTLARSAVLDRPHPGVRERVLERVLSEAGTARRLSPRLSAGLGVLAGLAAGIAATFFVAHSAEPPPATSVTPERAPAAPIPAPKAPVAPTPTPTAKATPPLPPCPRIAVAAGRAPLIDDFEDGNARLFPAESRAGTWRMNAPPGTKVTPLPGSLAFPLDIPGGRGKSRRALRFSGARVQTGAVALITELAPSRCYDASAYAGVEFFAKGKSRIRLQLTMIDMMEKRWGGLCDSNCYDAHSKAIELSPDFTRYEVRFSEVEQAGYGKAVPFNPRRLLMLDFSVDAADSPFDVWVDDVKFLER